MLSPIFGRSKSGNAPSATLANAISIQCIDNWGGVSDNAQGIRVPIGFTLSNLYVSMENAPGSGKSRSFTILKNGSATAVTLTISDTNSTGSDLVNTVSFTAGDTISLSTTPTNTPAATGAIWWNCIANASGQPILALSNSSFSSSNNYIPLFGRGGAGTTEGNYSFIVPTDGTLSNLYVKVTVAPGAGTSKIFTVYKNGVASALTASILDANTTSEDTTNSVSISAGDRISVNVNFSGAAAASVPIVGVLFTPTTNGQSIIGFASDDQPATGSTEYSPPATFPLFSATETDHTVIVGNWTLKKFYGRTTVASGAGKSYDIIVRKDLVSTTLTVNCSNVTTVQSITADVSITQDNKTTLAITPNGTPAATNINAGILVTETPATSPTTQRKTPFGSVMNAQALFY